MGYKVSPSSLKIFENCPRCFWLQVKKKISRPSMGFPTLPNGMDRILKVHFDKFRDKGELPPELCYHKHCEDMKLFDDEELLGEWRSNFKGVQYIDEEYGVLLHGAVDNILTKGKKLIVLDYKTRGGAVKEDTASNSQLQLDLYNFLLRKNNYDTEDYAFLLFYMPKEVKENGGVVFDTNLEKVRINIGNGERVFKEALDILESEEPPEPSQKCEFCRWAKGVTSE